ncbi:TolC family protein [Fluviicola taffensis]|uniref:TolC family protein n=1 Tax=Fluviicola taffensis TaxID=191579 RepID=UPI003137AD99
MKWFLYIGFPLIVSSSLSQQSLTLQTCIDRALVNSSQTATESSLICSSRLDKQFHWWSLLPNLVANAGVNTSFGRRLDPFTNTFATSSVNSQFFGLNSSVQLFNGFNYFRKGRVYATTIQLNELALSAKLNELKIQVIETYVTLCKLSKQKQLTQSRIEKYIQIQTIQRLLIREGRINVIDTLKSQHSLLREQELFSNLSNEWKLKTMQLNFLMGSPLRTDFTVDFTSTSMIRDKLKLQEKYRLESLEIELELLRHQLKSDRSDMLPSISLSGLVGTGFSTNNKDYSLPGSPTKSYTDQINQNLYEGIGVSLNVPLFNRGEWLKTNQLNAVKQLEIERKKEVADRLLEKHQLELEQYRLNNKAKLEQIRELADNLQLIYTKSLLLYEEGRLTYTEIETALMEWQMKLIEAELLKMEHEILNLYEH